MLNQSELAQLIASLRATAQAGASITIHAAEAAAILRWRNAGRKPRGGRAMTPAERNRNARLRKRGKAEVIPSDPIYSGTTADLDAMIARNKALGERLAAPGLVAENERLRALVSETAIARASAALGISLDESGTPALQSIHADE